MAHITEAKYDETFPGSEFTDDEIEFLKAIERYKRVNHRPFPTWHEVLRVLIHLGYRKVPKDDVDREPRPPSE